jgi:hypothetical protein
VVAKQASTYQVRVPGFVRREKVQAWRNGKEVPLAWNGDYVQFASVRAGDELTVTYPLIEFVQKLRRGGVDYAVHWKGNAVTGLSPRGKVWPLFEKIPFPTPPYRGE